jgi:hypothetical protein
MEISGTTDQFLSIPAVGQAYGLADAVTGQTFGTITSPVNVPTTFTANKVPVMFTY